MTVTLTDSLQARWYAYLATENSGTRDGKIQALTNFVDELLCSPSATWKAWAIDLAARIVDEGSDVPVRQPLFERVLFPALADALDAGTRGSARWLAGLCRYLHQCRACLIRLGSDRASEWALLRAAVSQDSTDNRSRQQLIRLIENRLRYSLHELPAGVLYDMNGATIAQCDELLAELNEFRALIAIEQGVTDYAPLIAECDYHFKKYKQYLLERPTYEGYQQFLEARRSNASEG